MRKLFQVLQSTIPIVVDNTCLRIVLVDWLQEVVFFELICWVCYDLNGLFFGHRTYAVPLVFEIRYLSESVERGFGVTVPQLIDRLGDVFD